MAFFSSSSFLLLSSFGVSRYLYFIIVLLKSTVWLVVTYRVLFRSGFQFLIF